MRRGRIGRYAGLVLAAAPMLLVGTAGAAELERHIAGDGCAAPPALAAIETALPRLAARLDKHLPLTIVAVGSSSTVGVGASSPDMNYPSQLEADLQQRFPGAAIRVINRGKSGEDAQEELARLDHDVVAEHPDLAIWQLGTNAVLRHDDPGADGERIERGIGLMRQNGTDVVLMDLQYAPRVLARPAYPQMEQAIADAAGHAHAGLFRRFDIMREWATVQPNDSQPMVGADGLHMTDRGYACISAALAEALGWNWWSQERARHHGPGATVAGLAIPVEAGSPVPPAQ